MASGRFTDYLAVIAIDFGTTYSGYAFSFKSSPDKIFMNKNWGGQTAGYKTITSLLVREVPGKGHVADEIGHEAEEKYSQQMIFGCDDENEKVYLFRRFKMHLFSGDDGKLNPDLKLTSEDKSLTLPALKVFTLALGIMKDKAKEDINKSCKSGVQDNDILWVLTVPAIWSDGAKDFMRKAALEAGMIATKDSNHLMIALEPEAASIYCRSKSIGVMVEGGVDGSMPVGTKYMVVDSGGGTIDIAVHEIIEQDVIKELHIPSGGDWGGSKVDAAFIALITDILGEKFITTLKQGENVVTWLHLLSTFEKKKCQKATKIGIEVSHELNTQFEGITGKKIKDVFTAYKKSKGNGVKFGNGIMTFEEEAVKKLFMPVISKITSHVEKLLSKPELKQVSYLMLVGGFSESAMMQAEFKKKFDSKYKLIIPQDTVLAVMSGAVMFGYNPSSIESRVARHTFGIALNEDFDPKKHDANRAVNLGGMKIVRDVFTPLVHKGENIKVNDVRSHEAYASSKNRHTVILKMYSTEKDNVKYIGPDTEEMGSIHMQIPAGTDNEKPLHLEFCFGGTEINVRVKPSKDSKQVHATASLDCLLH